jgi:hypothetical protein
MNAALIVNCAVAPGIPEEKVLFAGDPGSTVTHYDFSRLYSS